MPACQLQLQAPGLLSNPLNEFDNSYTLDFTSWLRWRASVSKPSSHICARHKRPATMALPSFLRAVSLLLAAWCSFALALEQGMLDDIKKIPLRTHSLHTVGRTPMYPASTHTNSLFSPT